MESSLLEEFKAALKSDDVSCAKAALRRAPEMIHLNVEEFDSPAMVTVRSREMLDALLDAGGDINARSSWWAGGFGLLDTAPPELATYAIERGAKVDGHAAARLGLTSTLKSLLERDRFLVHARGGDGKTPLHCAATVEIADLLLDQGADINARDIDHESTPAQHLLKDHPEVAGHLVEQGCQTDLLLAAALGNPKVVRYHLDLRPECIRLRVNESDFPKADPRGGGTIYQWTLGYDVGALQVARKFGHHEIVELLLESTPDELLLLYACECVDGERARALLEEKPRLLASLRPSELKQIAHAARNNQAAAVGLMLDCGWPVDAVGQHGATPLHWAAYHGNLEMARQLLRHNAPLDLTDADFQGTPLDWAKHGSKASWHRASGNYPETTEALLSAQRASL